MKHEILDKGGHKYALIPLEEYEAIMEDMDEARDIRTVNRIRAAIADGSEEVLPYSFIERRMAGESPLLIWRDYRGLTQQDLANKAGCKREMVSMIENGTKTGSVETLRALADVLEVAVDEILSVKKT